MKKIQKNEKGIILLILGMMCLLLIWGMISFYGEPKNKAKTEKTEQALNILNKEIKKSERNIENKLIIYSANGYMGLMNKEGKAILDGEKEKIREVTSIANSPLFECKTKDYDTFYYHNEQGKLWDYNQIRLSISAFEKYDYAIYGDVVLNKMGIIHKSGNITVPAEEMQYSKDIESIYFSGNYFAKMVYSDGKVGIMNYKGEILIEKQSELSIMASVSPRNKIAVISRGEKDKALLHAEKGWILTFDEVSRKIKYIWYDENKEFFTFTTKDGLDGIFNGEGEIAQTASGEELYYSSIDTFNSNGLAHAETVEWKSVIIDQTGKMVVTTEELKEKNIDELMNLYSDGTMLATLKENGELSRVFIDEKMAIISQKKELIEVGEYVGFHLFRLERGNYSLLTSVDGTEIINLQEAKKADIFAFNEFMSCGIINFNNKDDTGEGLLDKEGNILYPIKKGRNFWIQEVKNTFKINILEEDYNKEEYFYVNKDGAQFYRKSVDGIFYVGEDLMMVVTKNGKTKVFDENGYLINQITLKK